MDQATYLFCTCEKNEQEILQKFEAFSKTQTVDAFLLKVESFQPEAFLKLVQAIQSKGTALLIQDEIDFARRFQADGVQISYCEDLKKIRKSLEDISLGVLCASRDEAMRAGESGADYVAFDGEEAFGLTEWWVDLFTLPCVNFNLEHPSEKADFKPVCLSD